MATANNWRLFMLRRADPAFLAFQKKIHHRDHYTCQFCGFQAKEHFETINLNANYLDNKRHNLATACGFCAQCFFIESVGVGGYGGGTLVYLPELLQPEVNSLCHVLFCAITNDTGYSESAQSIYRNFKFRAQQVETQFGEGTSAPAFFGQMMIETQSNPPQDLSGILKDLRLLPSRAGFKTQIEHWAALALQELADSKQ